MDKEFGRDLIRWAEDKGKAKEIIKEYAREKGIKESSARRLYNAAKAYYNDTTAKLKRPARDLMELIKRKSQEKPPNANPRKYFRTYDEARQYKGNLDFLEIHEENGLWAVYDEYI